MQLQPRFRLTTGSATLLAIAAAVSLVLPGGAGTEALGGHPAGPSQFIARLNEAARAIAGAERRADGRRNLIAGPRVAVPGPARGGAAGHPLDRGHQPRGHRLERWCLYLPPPVSA